MNGPSGRNGHGSGNKLARLINQDEGETDFRKRSGQAASWVNRAVRRQSRVPQRRGHAVREESIPPRLEGVHNFAGTRSCTPHGSPPSAGKKAQIIKQAKKTVSRLNEIWRDVCAHIANIVVGLDAQQSNHFESSAPWRGQVEEALNWMHRNVVQIRTHGRLPVGSFQDCWFKPLTQLSGQSGF